MWQIPTFPRRGPHFQWKPLYSVCFPKAHSVSTGYRTLTGRSMGPRAVSKHIQILASTNCKEDGVDGPTCGQGRQFDRWGSQLVGSVRLVRPACSTPHTRRPGSRHADNNREHPGGLNIQCDNQRNAVGAHVTRCNCLGFHLCQCHQLESRWLYWQVCVVWVILQSSRYTMLITDLESFSRSQDEAISCRCRMLFSTACGLAGRKIGVVRDPSLSSP